MLILVLKKEKSFILTELKKTKEFFKENNEIQLIGYGRKLFVFIYGLFIFLSHFVLIQLFITNAKLLEIFKYLLLIIVIDVIYIAFVYKVYRKTVRIIELKEDLLIIKYGKSLKEYRLNNIDKLRIRITHGRYHAFSYLYIRDKDENKYTEFPLLNSFSTTKIIALIILIDYIKQNKIEAIDTITEEEIEKLKNEIKNFKIKNEDIIHIT